MTQVQRYDRGELRSAVKTPEGFYLVEGFVARPGVLEYTQADGSIRRELVLPEELHRADSLETLARKPVTLEHPEGGEFVTPENVEKYGVGDVDGDVTVERLNGFVKVKMAIRRADGIAAIAAGIVELSPGYMCTLDETPGNHEVYGRYDAIQRGRKYNHTAITRAGRAGAQVKLRKDSAQQLTPFDESAAVKPDREITMNEIAKMVAEQFARRDAENNQKNLAEENENLKKELDSVNKKLDEFLAEKKKDEDKPEDKPKTDEDADEKKADSAETRLAWFEARADALAVAAKTGANVTGLLEIPEIKKAVVIKAYGEQSRTDSAYIDAAFDLIKGQTPNNARHNAAYNGLSSALATPLTQPDARTDSAESAYMNHFNNAFKR